MNALLAPGRILRGAFAPRALFANLLAAAICALLVSGDARAEQVVDVELVLAVDVSLSMSHEELAIERDGYVAALRHDSVINAILDGANGRIAITYFEWAGDTTQIVVVPWTIIASKEDAEKVAEQLDATPPTSARRTSISGALMFARDLFAESPYRALKRVIDVSGDGPNNEGPFVDITRDQVVADGITVNGLPLMTDDGLTSAFDISDLDRYYAACVVGGPGAFVVPVTDWTQFPEAVRRKLELELTSAPPAEPQAPKLPVIKAAMGKPAFDCQVGEKRWRGGSWMFQQP